MSRELLFSVTKQDLEVQTFCAGGKGGQHQNKTETGVRIIHRPSGAVGEARDSRSQHQNKKAAFARMTATNEFQAWLKIEAAKHLGQPSIDEIVEAQMKPGNLKVEARGEDGKWEEV